MHLSRTRSLRALAAALVAGALLASSAQAAAPRTLNPQPEPPGVAATVTLKAGASEVLYETVVVASDAIRG